jgi:2-phosphosulfolactate phosphatase
MVRDDRPRLYVHLIPTLIPPGILAGGVAVVVDVLRATTVMVHALAAGCTAVIPCSEIEEARAVAAGLPEGTALLAGERHGLPIDGFDLGNSPGEFTPAKCAGKTLVMTTTNGTGAVLACLEARRVYIASFANLRATAFELAVQLLKRDHGDSVHVVCAGTEGQISMEDSLLAGALLRYVAELTPRSLPEARFGNDEAFIVASQWHGTTVALREHRLRELLAFGRGGQNVRRIGAADDITAASRIDCCELVAELCRDPLRIVKV